MQEQKLKEIKKMLSTNEYVLNHNGVLVNELLSHSVSTSWNEAIREWVIIRANVHRTLLETEDTVIYEHDGITEELTRGPITRHTGGQVFETYVDGEGNSRRFEVIYHGSLDYNYVDSQNRVVKKIMRCTCGREIEKITTLLNVNTSHVMIVGSGCASKFIGKTHMEELTNEDTLINVARVNTELLRSSGSNNIYDDSHEENNQEISNETNDGDIQQEGAIIQLPQQSNTQTNCHVLRYNTTRAYIGEPSRWRIFFVRRAQENFSSPLLLDPFLECFGRPVIGYFINDYDDIIIVPIKASQVFFNIQLKILLDIKYDFSNSTNGKIMKLSSLEAVRSAGIITHNTYVFYRSIALISEQRVEQHIRLYDNTDIRPVNFLTTSQRNSIYEINRQILCHLNNINNLAE